MAENPSSPDAQPGLVRRLGTLDAVVIGLGSMLGAGVFAAFAPAARAAGAGLLIGLAVAAVVAYCNATSSAQVAAVYPTSGGTYIYGRERLGDWWGFSPHGRRGTPAQPHRRAQDSCAQDRRAQDRRAQESRVSRSSRRMTGPRSVHRLRHSAPG